MIQNSEDLAAFIKDVLKHQERCRVFEHVLRLCWESSPARRAESIAAFAHQHAWHVDIHEPASFGIVADFRTSRPADNGDNEGEYSSQTLRASKRAPAVEKKPCHPEGQQNAGMILVRG